MKTTQSTASPAVINIRSGHAFAIGRACSILGLSSRVDRLVVGHQVGHAERRRRGRKRERQITDPNLVNAWGISHLAISAMAGSTSSTRAPTRSSGSC
jgi:hypothetical protein